MLIAWRRPLMLMIPEDNIKYLKRKLANIAKNAEETFMKAEEVLIAYNRFKDSLSYVVYDLRRIVEIFGTPDENDNDADI